jgi:hypothetical protein
MPSKAPKRGKRSKTKTRNKTKTRKIRKPRYQTQPPRSPQIKRLPPAPNRTQHKMGRSTRTAQAPTSSTTSRSR